MPVSALPGHHQANIWKHIWGLESTNLYAKFSSLPGLKYDHSSALEKL